LVTTNPCVFASYHIDATDAGIMLEVKSSDGTGEELLF